MLETGLNGRVCLVTGAAGDIGRACAELLAGEGAHLVLTDVTGGKGAPDGLWVTADLSTRHGVEEVFDAIGKHYGRLDVVIHAAGVYRVTPLPDVQDEEWDLVTDTNLRSSFLITQAAVEMMREHGDGRILLIASNSARTGGVANGGVHYAASKAGMAGLARNVANYAGPLGIRINVLNPGFTQTAMSASLGEAALANAAAATPLRRVAQPHDQASMAVVLVSDLAGFVHGTTLDVNGGTFMI